MFGARFPTRLYHTRSRAPTHGPGGSGRRTESSCQPGRPPFGRPFWWEGAALRRYVRFWHDAHAPPSRVTTP